ncbi:MAG: hypothetical protein M3P12_03485, partial [Gemmatimonadota bacterium]|nr:hypothetical protein [Gemmatimonadota bacterium]
RGAKLRMSVKKWGREHTRGAKRRCSLDLYREARVSSKGHPEQSAPIRARSRALIGGLCEDTAPQRTPSPTKNRDASRSGNRAAMS